MLTKVLDGLLCLLAQRWEKRRSKRVVVLQQNYQVVFTDAQSTGRTHEMVDARKAFVSEAVKTGTIYYKIAELYIF